MIGQRQVGQHEVRLQPFRAIAALAIVGVTTTRGQWPDLFTSRRRSQGQHAAMRGVCSASEAKAHPNAIHHPSVHLRHADAPAAAEPIAASGYPKQPQGGHTSLDGATQRCGKRPTNRGCVQGGNPRRQLLAVAVKVLHGGDASNHEGSDGAVHAAHQEEHE